MVQAVSLGILEPVVPVRSLQMPALSFLALSKQFSFSKLKTKASRGLQGPADIAFEEA